MANASTSRIKTNENIQVYLRVRPMNEREKHSRSMEAVKVVSGREIVVKDNRNSKKFTFDRTFGPDANQSDVYKVVVAPLIEEVLAGYNCTVFAYGQTGTGKTHTMTGEECSNSQKSWDQNSQVGIIPRAVSHLFEELRILGVEFSMRISFLELYNEELSDLLGETECLIRIYDDNNKKGSIIVNGLEELPVHSSADVFKLLAKGQEKRKTASTLMNNQSSRSHTIFSILVHIRENNVDGEEVLKVGKLNLVDLAGSENVNKAGNERGIRSRESANINQSLLTLGRVITALVERTPHVPYRESKLTRLLQESLGGRTKTSIIATISPADLDETLSTLEYAHRAKNIQNKPEVNQKLTKKLALKEYSEEIDRLKRDLMASRSKNGIYLAQETYDNMTCRLEAQNQELSEKQVTIKMLKDEMAKIQTIFNEVSLNLVQKETELVATYENLQSTQAELKFTTDVLQHANKKYREKKEILANHMATEETLTSQAKEIQTVADVATADTHLLHKTIERRKAVDHKIVSVCDNLEKSMQNNVNEMNTDIQDLNKTIKGEMQNITEFIEKSTARNNLFTVEVLDKCGAQRQLSEHNQTSFKNILDEKMTEELRSTDEQIALVESVFTQNIQTVREFNDGLSNEMLKSMLDAIKEQQTNLLEKLTKTKEMDCQHRSANANFRSIQATKMETLSTDVMNTMEKCRLAIDSALEKNFVIAAQISQLVEEFKSNNDTMKKIAPTMLKCVETMTNGTKEQIDDINKFNADDAKRCGERNDELAAISSAITEHTETSQNEITRIQKLVKNHTKLFSASLKSSKTRILEKLEQQKNLAATKYKVIESNVIDGIKNVMSSAASIAADIKSEDEHLKQDVKDHHDKNTTMKTIVENFSSSSIQKLSQWRNVLTNFRNNELKTYTPSGETPVKRDFHYPRVLAATSPHGRIIQRFWSAHNQTEVNVSASIFEVSQMFK
ncbi:Kinesin-like protein Klp61F [Pseudolycoriella hygida]|uniref:Kinesin-like protein n=1 Tax=Pseudolycoriella hygida TaxID=35572 RepID=A0A9Q0ML61_9DIPT|nr:Kinesin-like protein Klp61F [Pseudolycoriella hygida]